MKMRLWMLSPSIASSSNSSSRSFAAARGSRRGRAFLEEAVLLLHTPEPTRFIAGEQPQSHSWRNPAEAVAVAPHLTPTVLHLAASHLTPTAHLAAALLPTTQDWPVADTGTTGSTAARPPTPERRTAPVIAELVEQADVDADGEVRPVASGWWGPTMEGRAGGAAWGAAWNRRRRKLRRLVVAGREKGGSGEAGRSVYDDTIWLFFFVEIFWK